MRSSASSSGAWQITDEADGFIDHDDLADHRWRKLIQRAAEQAYLDGQDNWRDGDPRLW